MWMRFCLPISLIAIATPCYADASDITNIGDGISAYRLSASYCHWPIPPKINERLNKDEAHFAGKNPAAFSLGVKNATARFNFLTKSQSNYCKEIKESRDSMTQNLESRAK